MKLELTPSALLSQLHLLFSNLAPAKTSTTRKILVAFSGGLDSHVLLHLLSRISNNEFDLRAIYINHGLQVEANQWAEHCQKVCLNLTVDYQSVDLNLEVPKGKSIEEIARIARYKAISDNLLEDEILVTAHHQNDQAETLLLQLFRGAGVQGLASMPVVGEINSSQNIHLRPMLAYSRNELEAYAKSFDLKHIDDPSNNDIAFDRNFLRQTVMPILRDRWAGIDKTVSRAASIQAETKMLLDELAAEQLPNILSKEDAFSNEENLLALAPIDITLLREHSLSKQRLLLRYWISQQGFTNPSETKLSHIFTDLIDAADDRQPLIEWLGVELRRYQQSLYIMKPLSIHDASQVITWNLKENLFIESLGITLEAEILAIDMIETNQNIKVKFRQGGEKINLPKRGNISLKNLFQEQNIPTWIRSRLPLIYQDETLIKVVGLNDLKRHPPTF